MKLHVLLANLDWVSIEVLRPSGHVTWAGLGHDIVAVVAWQRLQPLCSSVVEPSVYIAACELLRLPCGGSRWARGVGRRGRRVEGQRPEGSSGEQRWDSSRDTLEGQRECEVVFVKTVFC